MEEPNIRNSNFLNIILNNANSECIECKCFQVLLLEYSASLYSIILECRVMLFEFLLAIVIQLLVTIIPDYTKPPNEISNFYSISNRKCTTSHRSRAFHTSISAYSIPLYIAVRSLLTAASKSKVFSPEMALGTSQLAYLSLAKWKCQRFIAPFRCFLRGHFDKLIL